MRSTFAARRIGLALAIAVVGSGSLLACGTCSNLSSSVLTLPHPQAIEIAVATRAAIEQGVLKDRPFIARDSLPGGGRPGTVAIAKVPGPLLVEAWATWLPSPDRTARPLSVHFLFVDTEQRCGLMLREGTVVFDPAASFHAESQVVTTRAVFHALVEGTLVLADAERLGLIRVEGDSATAMLFTRRNR